MEKRTVLAIALSVVVLGAYFLIMNVVNPPKQVTPPAAAESGAPVSAQTSTQEIPQAPVSVSVPETSPISQDRYIPEPAAGENISRQAVIVETDLIKVVLTNSGGNIISFQLKDHLDGGEPVEMIYSGDFETQAFAIAFGNQEDVIYNRVHSEKRNFRVKQITDLIVEFSQEIYTAQGSYFTLTKRYEFMPREYMFELTVVMDGGHSLSSFNFGGAAYTLVFGPQIGPTFAKLDQRYEYRNYLTYKGKLKNEKVNDKGPLLINSQPSWAAIAGKYFALVAMPYASQYDLAFSTSRLEAKPTNTSRLFITKPVSNSSRIEDKYHFYLGPKNQESLNIYNRGDNGFKLRETGLVEVAATKGFLSPVEKVLKWFLMLFHKMIPNYGVAIIFLTLLVKIVFFPLTKKGSESTIRMQALAPKIKEIQTKYKDNQQKMNQEMADFYKKEGYNPMMGCLPMLLQLPIFIAMYNLFNNHFDLRGAMFIPGWIPDLSVPEAIYNFPEGFKLPIVGWTALRLLPFIYVGSQLLYGKVTQTPGQGGNTQMKFMLYAMPIIFFFILYDVPSGLLLYWVMSNILTMVQQVGINKYLAHKKAVSGVTDEPVKPVIAPWHKKKKRK